MPTDLATALDRSTVALRSQEKALKDLERVFVSMTRNLKNLQKKDATKVKTVEAYDKAIAQKLQGMEDKNRLDALKGMERFEEQQRIALRDSPLRDSASPLREAGMKAVKEGNKQEADQLHVRFGELAERLGPDGPLTADQKKRLKDILEQQKQIKERNRLTKEWGELEKEISKSMGKAVENLVLGTKNWKEALLQVGAALAKIVVQYLASKWIQSIVSKGLGSVVGRSAGGPVRAGQPYLVGERGPELFRPATAGQIVPNHRLSGMTGRPLMATAGSSFQFNFHIESTDGPGVEAAIQRARPVLAQDAVELSKRVTRTDLSRPSPLRGVARR